MQVSELRLLREESTEQTVADLRISLNIIPAHIIARIYIHIFSLTIPLQ